MSTRATPCTTKSRVLWRACANWSATFANAWKRTTRSRRYRPTTSKLSCIWGNAFWNKTKRHRAMKKTLLRDWTLISVLVTATLALPLGCETAPGDQHTGSESHFLRSCSSDSECGPLSCLCGVCSSACGNDAACSDLAADAECIANAT